MKIAVVSSDVRKKKRAQQLIKKHGHKFVANKPQLVISYGGDGTFLEAERKYPGVPKVLIRYSLICNKCHNTPLDHVLEHLDRAKKYTFHKLEAKFKGKTFLATNDVIIRNREPQRAIRFVVNHDKKSTKAIIGDGVVVASAFGSNAYFHSITRKSFDKGWAIAFNNPTIPAKHIVLKKKSSVTFSMVRGKAVLVVDNYPKEFKVSNGDKVTIKQSKKTATILRIP